MQEAKNTLTKQTHIPEHFQGKFEAFGFYEARGCYCFLWRDLTTQKILFTEIYRTIEAGFRVIEPPHEARMDILRKHGIKKLGLDP